MKKSLLISMVAMMVFGLMGFGFAMWADSVTVSAAVETGDVQVGIRDVGTNDNILTDKILNGTPSNEEDGVNDAMSLGGDPQVTATLLSNAGITGVDASKIKNEEGKNVASMVSVNNGDAAKFQAGGVSYYDSITETISNAYPYYAPTTTFEIFSNGSIPVKIDDFVVEVSNTDADGVTTDGVDLTGIHYDWTINGTEDGVAFTAITGTGIQGENGLAATLEGIQLHQNDKLTVDLTVWFDQSTPENSSANLTLKLHACQWNEYGADIPTQTDSNGNILNWDDEGYTY